MMVTASGRLFTNHASRRKLPDAIISIFGGSLKLHQSILLASLIELGFLIVGAPNREAAAKTARAAYGRLLEGLLGAKTLEDKPFQSPKHKGADRTIAIIGHGNG